LRGNQDQRDVVVAGDAALHRADRHEDQIVLIPHKRRRLPLDSRSPITSQVIFPMRMRWPTGSWVPNSWSVWSRHDADGFPVDLLRQIERPPDASVHSRAAK